MARPSAGYQLHGTTVPGVSTVAKLISEPRGLVHWAWQQGVAGLDYRQTREDAAQAGTMVHAAAEAWKRGRPYTFEGPDDLIANAMQGFDNFLQWAAQTRLKIEQTEVSLVSARFRYGGTFDAILMGEQRVMCDFKTSAAVYPEHLLQVVAYAKLWEENHPDQPIDGGYCIVRFSRDRGDFAHNMYSELDEAWEAFLLCRRLYEKKAALSQRCR